MNFKKNDDEILLNKYPEEENKKSNLSLTKIFISFIKIFITILSLVFFIINYNKFSTKKEINIDNQFEFIREDNLDFSKYSTNIKPIALYNSKINLINDNNININRILNEDDLILKKLKNEIDLAKNHGIYGFGFCIFWPLDKSIFNNPHDLIIQNKNLDINFLLILEKNTKENKKIKIDINEIFDYIKNYTVDERYIKFDNNPMIGINDFDINEKDINALRQKFKENGLGDIFILSSMNNYKNKQRNFDGLYYIPSYDSLEKVTIYYNNTFGYFYTHLLYDYLLEQKKEDNNNNIYIFYTSVPLTKYPIYEKKTKSYIYGDYIPEKFYLLNKIIINKTLENNNKDHQFIFIDGFNNLKFDSSLGYSNINSFSKALYGLPFISNENFNLENLKKDTLVLVQAHIFYTDSLSEIINKTNNMPVPFDLYITTDTEEKKDYIENYLLLKTKAKKFEVLVTQNKGRDVIPCIIQIKDIIYKYKYFCHIHSKKHGESDLLGNYWKNYLFENLLGNETIIQKILSDFENNNKLGLMFPEHFYVQIKYAYGYNYNNWKHMNNLFDILIKKNYKAGDIGNFPVGNMFWARVDAIHQMFTKKIFEFVPEERGQIDGTILHAIERFWLLLAKVNGYYYKTILYYI